jgi:hypothetical protein
MLIAIRLESAIGIAGIRTPVHPPAWAGVRDALAYGPSTPQTDPAGRSVPPRDAAAGAEEQHVDADFGARGQMGLGGARSGRRSRRFAVTLSESLFHPKVEHCSPCHRWNATHWQPSPRGSLDSQSP